MDSSGARNPREEGEGSPREEDRLAGRLARLLGKRMNRAVWLLFLLAVLFRYFDQLVNVLLIAFIGAILAIAFNKIVVRIPLKRGYSTAIVALLTIGAIAAGIWFAVTFMVGQLRALLADMPSLMASVEEWEAWLQELTGLDLELLGPRVQQIIGDLTGGVQGGTLIAGAFGLVELVAMSVLVLIGAFFVVAHPNEQLLNPILRSVPPERRPAFRRMFERMGDRLGGWLIGTLISMLIIGALATVALYLIGAPYPLLLGPIIGLTDIIPLIGPWIGGIVAVVVTLLYDPGLVLWVALAVLVIQEVEGNLVRPFVMSGHAKLHPFVTLMALLLFGSLFGLLGAILALPIVLMLGTVVEVLWVEETLEAGDEEIEPLVETE
jgi:putative permease